jgi:hypothetical protein
MSYDTFKNLQEGLRPVLKVSKKNKRKNVADSSTTMIIGTRFLAGASYLSLARLFNRSKKLVFKCIHRFMGALASHETIGVVEWEYGEARGDE